ncbi:LOW QUALITY PROTEIN: putative regulatory protein, partial [Streptomyces himastatinicus ATCC 53653]
MVPGMEEKAMPPTVPVPLAVLLDHPGLGLRQVAGPRGEAPVYLVHTSEMEDPVPYLLGGELLLSAGVHGPEATDAYWDRYVARTVEAGATALGFGVAPVHQEVPRALIEACDRHGLPLVEVPRETTFTAVASAVWDAMAERRHQELRRITEVQQSLAAAAARPHPVPAVLRLLARHLGGWAVLYGPDGAELAAAGPRPSPEVRGALASLAARLRAGPASAAGTADGAALSAYGLGGPERPLALGVCAPRRDATETAVVGVAMVLLALLTGRRTADAGAERTALVRLMLGAEPAEVAGLLSGAEMWTVVRGRRRGRGDDGLLAAAALAAGLGTHLVDLAGDELCALVPGDAEVRAQPGWTLGAGAPGVRRRTRARAAPTRTARCAGRSRSGCPWCGTLRRAARSPHWSTRPRPIRWAAPGSHRWTVRPPCARRCGRGCRCTAVGTVRRWRWTSTAIRSANASPAPRPCWRRTWATRTCGWNCGSPSSGA